MNKEDVITKKAPQAIGPYSQAIRCGNLVFCSGQIGINPRTNKYAGNNIRSQTKQVFKNLKQVLLAAGADFHDVVKVHVYLKDMNDFSEMNKIYATCFKKPYPARATVEVAQLPKDALVEIDCIAVI